MTATVLLVDDEVRSLDAMRRTLEEDFEVLTATGADEAREQMARREVHVILCDQRMPGTTGVEFLREARERWPDAVRIVISGYTDSEDIIAGINEAGIWQYILKPWVPDHLLQTVRSAAEARTLQHGLARLDLELRSGHVTLRAKGQAKLAQARSSFDFARLVRAPGSPLDALCEMAQRIARHDLSVLILGESGTGKELMARAIHYASPRLAGPFVVENCAAIPDTLLESELFGHKRGAFTGAVDDHVGLFQRAHGGTVFLDEIGEMSPALQAKLLRVLETGRFRRVGGTKDLHSDVRFIAATNRDLEGMCSAGLFREDLYYRLSAFVLKVAPLRERDGDIALLAEHFLRTRDFSRHASKSWSRAALDLLMSYSWPGNVRELRNAVERAALVSGNETEIRPAHCGQLGRRERPRSEFTFSFDRAPTLEQIADVYLARLLEDSSLTREDIASILGVSERNVYRMLERQRASHARAGGDKPLQSVRASSSVE